MTTPTTNPTAKRRNRTTMRLRIADLCERYGVCRASIHRWVKNGTLPEPTYIGDIPTWSPDQVP
jgi:predicted DNA-binding transcriptional regulator AlpA